MAISAISTPSQSPAPSAVLDRLDAARALLGCGTATRNSGIHAAVEQFDSSGSASTGSFNQSNPASSSSSDAEFESIANRDTTEGKQSSWVSELSGVESKKDSGLKFNGRLDALAMLAFSATIADNSDSMSEEPDAIDGAECRPPNTDVRMRFRSASCPEGMEKWDAFGTHSQQQHFTEPYFTSSDTFAPIKEDQQETNYDGMKYDNEIVMGKTNTSNSLFFSNRKLPFKKRGKISQNLQHQDLRDKAFDLDDLNSVALSICSFANRTESCRPNHPSTHNLFNMDVSMTNVSMQMQPDLSTSTSLISPAIIEDPTELLRQARARLLEDLHDNSNGASGEKGVMRMPHLLAKYKELYNKNGRIGIYTPNERAAIIAKFNSKRTRRVWNKKIRYNCRKNLADRRVRVKGRFVKRSSEEAAVALAAVNAKNSNNKLNDDNQSPKKETDTTPTSSAVKQVPPSTSNLTTGSVVLCTSNTPSPTHSSLPTVSETEPMDSDIVSQEKNNDFTNGDDTVDEEPVYLEPTDDQPFRRARRYTIT